MAIGRYGSLNFICSRDKVQTFKNLSRKRDIRYEQHDVVEKMPMLEFVGYGLYEASFTMRFDLTLGVKPIDCLTKLQNMMDNKMYKWLVVGEEFLGRYVITSITENHIHHAADGTLLVAEATVELKEWSRGK